MFDTVGRLGVQSWCFRNFKTTEALLAEVKKIGLARVELCGVHADLNDESKFEPVVAAFKKAGVAITSIGVQTFADDAAKEENWFKFAKLAGATMISTSFDVSKVPGAYRTVERLGDKYDINLGIHNHGGYHWLGSRDMLSHVFKNTSARVGLCMDSAWMMQAGEDPIKAAEQFQARLYGVHIKDFVFNRAGRTEDVVVGTGNLKLAELLALINKTPHCKCVTLEYEGDVENPGPKLKECVDKVQAEG